MQKASNTVAVVNTSKYTLFKKKEEKGFANKSEWNNKTDQGPPSKAEITSKLFTGVLLKQAKCKLSSFVSRAKNCVITGVQTKKELEKENQNTHIFENLTLLARALLSKAEEWQLESGYQFA